MAPIPGIAGPGAPYPQWGVVVGSPGQHVTKVTNAGAKYLMEAVAFPSKVYFFVSEQAAADWVAANGGQHYIPGSKGPLTAANTALNTATGLATGAWSLSWAGAGHFALRLAEAVVGIAFLIIGLNALLHNPAGKVIKAVRP